MIDAQTQAVLQEIVRRESRSLLIYVGDAFPWTTSRGEATLGALRSVIEAERAAVNALGQYLARRRLPQAPLGSYPSYFTTLNFVGLDYLLPRLVAAERSSILELEQGLGRVGDAEAKAQVQKLLGAKRSHLTALEGLAIPGPPVAAAGGAT